MGMGMAERSSCDYCGEDLDYRATSTEPATCGKPECERLALDEMRGREEDAMLRAAEDGYAAYGGPGRFRKTSDSSVDTRGK